MFNNNELLQKLHQIKLDKEENIRPENIRKGVTALGVEGTLEEVHIINQDKTVEPKVTSQDVEPDEGFTGLGKVTVEGVTNSIDSNISPENIRKDVSILGVTGNLEEVIINNQDKTISPTTDEQTVSADEGYTGLGAVTVGAVTNSIDANIIPENIKKDISILGVLGVLEQGSGTVAGVKQFASIEEMNATTGNEGDLAVVYANSLANFTVDTEAQVITFPKTVTLPSAYTGNAYTMFMSTGSSFFDASVELGATYFSFNGYGDNGEISVGYSSTDGITYTRTDGGDLAIDLGTPIKCMQTDMWDDMFGYFMCTGGANFGGLFTCDGTIWNAASSQLDATSMEVFEKTFYGQNGVEIGTLGKNTGLSISELFTKAKVWSALYSLTPSVTVLDEAFVNYTGTRIPQIDTSNVTSMNNMFAGCKSLIEVPQMDTSNVTKMGSMFRFCSVLTEVPLLDTSNVANMYGMFTYCGKLTTVPQFDTSSVTNMRTMFDGCSSLSDQSLNNILAMCANAKNITDASSKRLSSLSLTSAQATRCKSLSNYSAFTAAGWTTGY